MASVMEAVEVDAPVRTAYDQWTQCAGFPQFMEGVKQILQLDDTHVRWTARVAGDTKEWTSAILEQIPDERAPAARLGATPFDERLGARQVALHPPHEEAQRVADALRVPSGSASICTVTRQRRSAPDSLRHATSRKTRRPETLVEWRAPSV